MTLHSSIYALPSLLHEMILITFRGRIKSLSLLDRMFLMSPMLRLMIQLRVVTRLT